MSLGDRNLLRLIINGHVRIQVFAGRRGMLFGGACVWRACADDAPLAFIQLYTTTLIWVGGEGVIRGGGGEGGEGNVNGHWTLD